MMDLVQIKGILPGLNEYTAALAVRRGKWSKGADMKHDMTELCRLASLRTHHFTGPVYMVFTWFERDARRDPDNIVFAKKFVLDGLVAAGVIPNDSQKYIKGFSESIIVDPALAGVHIMIGDQEYEPTGRRSNRTPRKA